MRQWSVQTGGPDQTRDLGRLFGSLAEAGLVVLLNGDLGAGKTCFAQGVAAGLGVPAGTPVTSPSYALLNIHQGRIPLHHFDLYRLSRVDDLADLGYDEFAEGEGLTLVEWADRMAGALEASLTVSIVVVDRLLRELAFVALDERGGELLGRVAREWSERRQTPAMSRENL